jgi:hypothetical protein
MIDAEKRKAATIKLARELYELMPGAAEIPRMNGVLRWDMIEVTKPYCFCMLIAARIVAADCRVHK